MTFVVLGEATNHVMWLRFQMDINLYIQHDPCTWWSSSCACFFIYMFVYVRSCSMTHDDMVLHVHSGANSHIGFVYGHMEALQGHSWSCFMLAWFERMNMGYKTDGDIFCFGYMLVSLHERIVNVIWCITSLAQFHSCVSFALLHIPFGCHGPQFWKCAKWRLHGTHEGQWVVCSRGTST